MLSNNQYSEEKQSNTNSTIQSKDRIFNIEKVQHKGKLETNTLTANKSFVTGKWTTEEKEIFIHSSYIHGPKWKKIKHDIQSRTIGQIRSHAHKYMIKLCKKYGIQVINKKHKRFIKKNTNHLIQKKKESKWKNINGITIEEIKFLKEFNFYIKKYDERLYKLIYSDEIAFEEQKRDLILKVEEIQKIISDGLLDIININYLNFHRLFSNDIN